MSVLQIYWCLIAFVALATLVDISKSLVKIAAKLQLRESNWANGYKYGCIDTKRKYGIQDGDQE